MLSVLFNSPFSKMTKSKDHMYSPFVPPRTAVLRRFMPVSQSVVWWLAVTYLSPISRHLHHWSFSRYSYCPAYYEDSATTLNVLVEPYLITSDSSARTIWSATLNPMNSNFLGRASVHSCALWFFFKIQEIFCMHFSCRKRNWQKFW